MSRSDVNRPSLEQSPFVVGGRQIQVAVASINAGTATNVHSADPKQWQVLTIECSNTSAVDLRLWLTWGGSAAGDLSVHTVPAYSTVVVIDRRRVKGISVAAYETTGSGALNVYPQVDTLTEEP
jgi:hypothetical protein